MNWLIRKVTVHMSKKTTLTFGHADSYSFSSLRSVSVCGTLVWVCPVSVLYGALLRVNFTVAVSVLPSPQLPKRGLPDCVKAPLKTGWTHAKGFHPPGRVKRHGQFVNHNWFCTVESDAIARALHISDPVEWLHRCTAFFKMQKLRLRKCLSMSRVQLRWAEGSVAKCRPVFLNTATESNFTS